MYQLKKVNSNKYGTTFKLIDPIIFTLNNTKSIFGIEHTRFGKYVKWLSDDIVEISQFNDFLKKNNEDLSIKSPIINRENYPQMLSTKIPDNKNADIIKSEKGDVSTISEFIKKHTNYNLILEIKNIFIAKDQIKYSVYIKKIEIAF